MNAQELASLLNGREYTREVMPDEAFNARNDGLVIVFGASDDLMELRGATDDEIDCYGGGTAYLTSAGILRNECDEDNCPYFCQIKSKAATIKAIFDRDGYTWVYETDIPHHTFDVMEDGNKYCRGIVFALADVKDAP